MATPISRSLPNLTNGISQQPATLRLASQCETQINGLSSLVDGLSKRPPTEHVSRLSTSDFSGAYVHFINRDSSERYAVVVLNGDLKVYNLTSGVTCTVTYPDGKGYLPTSSEVSRMRAVSIADYTILVNRDKTTAKSGAASADRDPDAMIHVSKGAYGAYYQIKLDGTEEASFTTSTTDATDIQTTNIASELYDDLVAGATGYSVALNGNVIYIKKTDGSDFDIEAYDSEGSSGMILLKGKTQQFKDLPKRGYDGFTIEIAGTEDNSYDNWWVKYIDDTNASGGHWEETVKPGLDDNFDVSEMPHQLVRTALDTFVFEEISWDGRGAGDDVSAADPSFIGEKLNGVFFYRNRLGFLADENVIMSRTADFFNFWPETVTTVLDTDPIDIASTHQQVSILHHAVPMNEQMILTSHGVQFSLSTDGEVLTPNTVQMKPSTEFSMNPDIAPITSGHDMYFVTKAGDWAGLREYFAQQDNTGLKDASLVTAHVPSMIPSDSVRMIVGSSDVNSILVVGDGTYDNRVWVYRYHWAGDDKLQSSWSYWEFDDGDEILGIDIIDGIMYMVVNRTGGMFLDKLDFSSQRTENDLEYLVHLDRKQSITGVYDSTNHWTTWTLPYTHTEPSESNYRIVTGGGVGFDGNQGEILPIPTRPSSTTLRVTGDYSADDCYIGAVFTFTYGMSEQIMKSSGFGGGDSARTDGRLQLNRWRILYANTGYFKVEVTPKYRDTFEYKFTGRILGEGTNPVGSAPISDGMFTFPVKAGAHQVDVTISSDSHLPCSLQSAEWEGIFIAKTKRV